MSDEEEFFSKTHDLEVIPPDLLKSIKDHRDQMMHFYAVIVANPYKANLVLDDMRRNLSHLAATLMEHMIPLDLPTKDKTAEDVLKQAAGELGSMWGAQGVSAGLSFARQVKENISSGEYIDIYTDDVGNFFFMDDDGNEVLCTEEGVPFDDDDDEEEDD